jgi:hypothetical protein
MSKTFVFDYEYIIPEVDSDTITLADDNATLEDAEEAIYDYLSEKLPPEVTGVSIEMVKEVN